LFARQWYSTAANVEFLLLSIGAIKVCLCAKNPVCHKRLQINAAGSTLSDAQDTNIGPGYFTIDRAAPRSYEENVTGAGQNEWLALPIHSLAQLYFLSSQMLEIG
jgi:hypothetical protein